MALYLGAVGLGLVLLTFAADHFVIGAARLASTLKVSAVTIGAVVIGFGTSLPELVVSGLASGQRSVDIAVGNIIGSNIANLTLVLGVAALIFPPVIDSVTLRREAPLSVAAVVVFAIFVQGGFVRPEGSLLLLGLVVFLWWIVRSERRTSGEEDLTGEVAEIVDPAHEHPLKVEIPRTLAGMAGTLVGAQLLVYGARGVSDTVGLSEGFVGLTLVAVGTSLPELVTAIQSARREQDDLIVGNLLGSNIFNSFAVGGLAAAVGPGPVDTALSGLATLIMVAVAVVAWWFMRSGNRVVRWEAAVLLTAFPTTVVIVGI